MDTRFDELEDILADRFESIEDSHQTSLAYQRSHSAFLASPVRAAYRVPTQEFHDTMATRAAARLRRQMERREARDARRAGHRSGGHSLYPG